MGEPKTGSLGGRHRGRRPPPALRVLAVGTGARDTELALGGLGGRVRELDPHWSRGTVEAGPGGPSASPRVRRPTAALHRTPHSPPTGHRRTRPEWPGASRSVVKGHSKGQRTPRARRRDVRTAQATRQGQAGQGPACPSAGPAGSCACTAATTRGVTRSRCGHGSCAASCSGPSSPPRPTSPSGVCAEPSSSPLPFSGSSGSPRASNTTAASTGATTGWEGGSPGSPGPNSGFPPDNRRDRPAARRDRGEHTDADALVAKSA